jgi:ATP-dependent Clp protease adaptor protein ClpS
MPDTITAPERVKPVEAEPEAVEETDAGEPDRASDKPWHVILLDDNAHTYDYVIEMLGAIFGYNLFKAFKMAREVDTKKRVIVKTCHLEKAEAYQEQIHAYGPDWRMPESKGSMSAILEQAS